MTQKNLRWERSHLARGAWIEISVLGLGAEDDESHLARGAWIEMERSAPPIAYRGRSHLARGAWIEIFYTSPVAAGLPVAPRKRCVD